ncbi:MAG: prepilin-type N-terminal cleavage/methylation domain-containing protein [Candidatus Gastranaerophilales bacterium]|nr:prepilin-type N-terminal cleavage/methylation domain-containing protein [Candidatus Gastranaerophilales bacterium]
MKKAFTLAEVLITLVIIGVIAAMTIPSLLNNTNKEETKTAVKKAYTTLSQAVSLAQTKNGSINNLEQILAEMNISSTESCSSNTACKSMLNGVTDFINSNNDEDNQTTSEEVAEDLESMGWNKAVIGADGMTYLFIEGLFFVDVNGERKPNKMTTDIEDLKDEYAFFIRGNSANLRVFPVGPAACLMFGEDSDICKGTMPSQGGSNPNCQYGTNPDGSCSPG